MSVTYRIQLAWPEKALSSNYRGHWRPRHKATKTARETAFWEAKAMGLPKWPQAVLRFEFYPPDARRRDIQNMPHMCKAAIDGIADAMGCDDHGFRPQFPDRFGETRKGGVVVIEVEEGAL